MIITNTHLRPAETNFSVRPDLTDVATIPSGIKQTKTNEPLISEHAKILSSLYATASNYIQSEHLQKFNASDYGHTTEWGYLDVGRYNDYVFDKAATTMIAAAKESGFTLSKGDIITQLKDDHSDIASIKLEDDYRRSKLGPNHIYLHLSVSDLDSLTSAYITAKENGLDTDEFEGLAFSKAWYNSCPDRGEADMYPCGWDFSETDPDKIEAAKLRLPDSITSKANEIRNKIQGDLGLGVGFMKSLLNPRLGLQSFAAASLDFISALVDIYNQQQKNSL